MCKLAGIGCECSDDYFDHPDLCISHYVAYEIWISNGGYKIYASQVLSHEQKRECFQRDLQLLGPRDAVDTIERKFCAHFAKLEKGTVSFTDIYAQPSGDIQFGQGDL